MTFDIVTIWLTFWHYQTDLNTCWHVDIVEICHCWQRNIFCGTFEKDLTCTLYIVHISKTLVNVANDNMDLGGASASKESQPAFEDGKREKKLISGRAGMPKI